MSTTPRARAASCAPCTMRPANGVVAMRSLARPTAGSLPAEPARDAFGRVPEHGRGTDDALTGLGSHRPGAAQRVRHRRRRDAGRRRDRADARARHGRGIRSLLLPHAHRAYGARTWARPRPPTPDAHVAIDSGRVRPPPIPPDAGSPWRPRPCSPGPSPRASRASPVFPFAGGVWPLGAAVGRRAAAVAVVTGIVRGHRVLALAQPAWPGVAPRPRRGSSRSTRPPSRPCTRSSRHPHGPRSCCCSGASRGSPSTLASPRARRGRPGPRRLLDLPLGVRDHDQQARDPAHAFMASSTLASMATVAGPAVVGVPLQPAGHGRRLLEHAVQPRAHRRRLVRDDLRALRRPRPHDARAQGVLARAGRRASSRSSSS